MSRLTPLPRDEWPTDLTTFIADFRATVIGDTGSAGGQSGANLLGTLARYPALTIAFLRFNGHALYGTSLTARQRELIVLRVASLRQADYEWAQHVVLAEAAGLRDDEIARVTEGPDAAGWAPLESALLRAADELIADGSVGDQTWKTLSSELDEHQLMDVVFTVGTYEMVAFALRSFGVEAEDDLLPYLRRGR
ncbi:MULTISPECIES: carboxymuconolactone decarboxylase family protein [unclassified Parafrankia]|uniref:carboxymuconolactone decarboxylase family protein n=1 Tax=Parafrankia TaxID=2994362 RepID=UPI000DA54B47|nr:MULTISPECIES: carboxymuconolactone decarboxylase family protein [unclassified Parafrankia]TCJ31901.1 carboxymuconolactone decarboxylase family protein [Parafrankia sp. BMG5.11]CAI7974043.1 Carboxymuconolactone decarboxylase [Frankia sp. Hr75.2]SQE00218.1 Carboxymuconolactone decarboxylase [Parafrankia sp. Ea1.12]